ncbi:MAG: hypothetical protein JOZ15_14865, partial [Acidobacteria bacterium]|nr:hypothetical protein [Acidobacteriota bacterium]
MKKLRRPAVPAGAVASVVLLCCLAAAPLAAQLGAPLPPPLPLLPPDNWWNLDVSRAPVSLVGAKYIGFIGA